MQLIRSFSVFVLVLALALSGAASAMVRGQMAGPLQGAICGGSETVLPGGEDHPSIRHEACLYCLAAGAQVLAPGGGPVVLAPVRGRARVLGRPAGRRGWVRPRAQRPAARAPPA